MCWNDCRTQPVYTFLILHGSKTCIMLVDSANTAKIWLYAVAPPPPPATAPDSFWCQIPLTVFCRDGVVRHLWYGTCGTAPVTRNPICTLNKTTCLCLLDFSATPYTFCNRPANQTYCNDSGPPPHQKLKTYPYRTHCK